jgi:hypothetical protein
MAITFARGFVFEYVLCQAFPLAMNSTIVIKEMIAGQVAGNPDWHPSWTKAGPKSRDPIQIADENMNMCLIQAIAAGFIATLPLLLLTLKYSRYGRAIRFARPAEPPGPPRKPREPCLGSVAPRGGPIFALYMPSLLFQPPTPCGGVGDGGSQRGGGSSGRSNGGGNEANNRPTDRPPPKDPPKEPPKDPCDLGTGNPAEEQVPPTERPNPNVTEGQREPPAKAPPEFEGPISPSEQVREAVNNLWAANAARVEADARTREALGELIRYRVNKPELAERAGGLPWADPSKFDPAEYARLQQQYDDARAISDLRYTEWRKAQQALEDAQRAQKRANGAGGRGCFWGPPVHAGSVAGAEGASNALGGGNPPSPGTPKQ